MSAYGTPRLRRQYVFLMGLLSGMAFTAAAFCLTAATVKPEPAPGWNRSVIVSAGRSGGRWYIRNTGGRDYHLTPEAARIFERGELGLMASGARLAAPAFVPAGETVALSIDPEPEADLVVFDTTRHIRIELGRGGGR